MTLNQEEFCQRLYQRAVDETVEAELQTLEEPPGRNPSHRLREVSDWYRSLSATDRRFAAELLRRGAESGVFGVLAILDGVRPLPATQGDPAAFELWAGNGDRAQLNDPALEMLHDVFQGVAAAHSGTHDSDPVGSTGAFVQLLTFERAGGPPGEEAVSAEDVCERFATHVRELDGSTRTLVTAYGGDRAHLAVGGDATQGVVAYATIDNVHFYQLVGEFRPGVLVRVVAGGQPGDYPGGVVVAAEDAIRAARSFLIDGELDDDGWVLMPSGGP